MRIGDALREAGASTHLCDRDRGKRSCHQQIERVLLLSERPIYQRNCDGLKRQTEYLAQG